MSFENFYRLLESSEEGEKGKGKSNKKSQNNLEFVGFDQFQFLRYRFLVKKLHCNFDAKWRIVSCIRLLNIENLTDYNVNVRTNVK